MFVLCIQITCTYKFYKNTQCFQKLENDVLFYYFFVILGDAIGIFEGMRSIRKKNTTKNGLDIFIPYLEEFS